MGAFSGNVANLDRTGRALKGGDGAIVEHYNQTQRGGPLHRKLAIGEGRILHGWPHDFVVVGFRALSWLLIEASVCGSCSSVVLMVEYSAVSCVCVC